MKKGLLTIIIVALITLGLGFGVFLLLSPKSSDNAGRDSVSKTTSTTSISGSDGEDSDDDTNSETDTSSDDGVVYIGGEEVSTVPEVTLGDSEVYASSDSDNEEESEESSESLNDSEDTTERANDTDEDVTDLEKQPLNVTVTNKDYRIWSIFWVTNTAQTGYINHGTTVSVQENTAYDDRDTGQSDMVERYTHHVTITNSEGEIADSNPTFYFNIVSGGTEFYDYTFPYEYENATLTSSPSTPNSISITAGEVTGFDRNDCVVLAKMIDSSGVESTVVSDVFNSSGGIDLSIGIARVQSLESYFPYSTNNDVSVKIYAPNGYTGFAESISLSRLSDEILNVQINQTGYDGSVFSTSGSGDYSFTDRYPTADTTVGSEESLPQTGVENEWAFTSVFGFVVFLLGAFCVLLFIPWNYKKLWERKVVGEIDDMV